MFSNAKYLKAYRPLSMDTPLDTGAPRFRRRFVLSEKPVRAEVCYAGLGYGYFYLNGKSVTPDLFTAPVSDYTKTVWYNRYDVTDLLQTGDNVAAAILGNGWYNEAIDSVWGHYKAHWRDVPKLIFQLEMTFADGRKETVVSDGAWVCTDQSAYLYNALRSGETYDARLEEPGWNGVGFDDSGWKPAQIVDNPNTGILRECTCQPIREFEVYDPIRVTQYGDRWIYEFPQNISGYVRLHTGSLLRGQRVTIRYAEDCHEDGTLELFGSAGLCRRPGLSRYAYNDYISDGTEEIWSPKFSYFGFRFVEVTGLVQTPPKDFLQAVFVHQDVSRTTSFCCSDYRLNQLYHMGIFASWSNMFYMPTDCPTREKLGWGNDTQSSTEQFVMNFDSVPFLKKWYQDILDAMHEDGALPAIVPSPGWGYTEMYTGPNSNGALFEIPWQIYQYTGDKTLLCAHLPEMRKYLQYVRSRQNEQGLIEYGLPDWGGPWDRYEWSPTPVACSDTLLYIKFLKYAQKAAELAGEDASDLKQEEQRITQLFLSHFFTEEGTMTVEHETGLSMALMLDVYPNREVIANQLVATVEQNDRHLDFGMLGVRYVFDALEKIGRNDLAYAVATAAGYPGFFHWITERNATTMCENFRFQDSQNHHMFSCVLVWVMKNLGGIRPAAPGYTKCVIRPYFPANLSYCNAYQDTVLGRVSVDWKRTGDGIALTVSLPEGMEGQIEYNGEIHSVKTGNQRLLLKQ